MAYSGVRTLNADELLPTSSNPVTEHSVLHVHTDEVWSVKWSSTGAYLASGCKDCKAIIWGLQPETDTFVVLHYLDHDFPVTCLAWSPDDSFLLTASEQTIKMWNVKTGECLKVLDQVHSDTITCLLWLGDSHGIISASLDRQLIFWSSAGEREDTVVHDALRPVDIAVSPDYSRLLVLGIDIGVPSTTEGISSIMQTPPHRMIICDFGDRKALSTIAFRNETTNVRISKDSRHAIINEAPGKVHLCDIHSGQIIKIFPGHKQMRHVIKGSYGGENDEYIISGSEDGKIYIWDSQTTSLLHALSGHGPGTVNAVSWRPFSKDTFASCSDDSTVRIWKLEGPPAVGSDVPEDNTSSWVLVDSSDFD